MNAFNHRAYEENYRTRQHIEPKMTLQGRVLVIDPYKATYNGINVFQLNKLGRRKFENRIFLQHMHDHRREKVKIIYK